eukprot:scaffold10604_cov114-Skeletonema_dohrnii-CCMP3373.AAC.1
MPYVDIPEEMCGFLMDEMEYWTELAVLDYSFSTQRTSIVALTAMQRYRAIGVMRSKGHQERPRAFIV